MKMFVLLICIAISSCGHIRGDLRIPMGSLKMCKVGEICLLEGRVIERELTVRDPIWRFETKNGECVNVSFSRSRGDQLVKLGRTVLVEGKLIEYPSRGPYDRLKIKNRYVGEGYCLNSVFIFVD